MKQKLFSLTLALLAVTPLLMLITKLYAKKVRPLFHKRSVMLGELNGFVEEVISGQKTTKAYHQEAVQTRRFDEKNREVMYLRITGELSFKEIGINGRV